MCHITRTNGFIHDYFCNANDPLLKSTATNAYSSEILPIYYEETNIRILVAGVLLSYVTTTLMCEPIY